MTRNRFFSTLAAGLLVLLIADKIHPGSARFILDVSFVSYLLYLFWNMDKPWARNILNQPKKWWQ